MVVAVVVAAVAAASAVVLWRCRVEAYERPAILGGELGRLLCRGFPCAGSCRLCLVTVEDVKIGSISGAVAARFGTLVADRPGFIALAA